MPDVPPSATPTGDEPNPPAAPTASAGHGATAAAVIGPYQLLQKIGEGGMGEVWLAEQRQPVRRRVAVKLIRAGRDSREVLARFASERQALALMDHPNIAKVFDAGSTAQGLPYFAMEYAAGPPITTYCDQQRLTTRQRLELFLGVCDGVQHAHQKAILHRDLKPSNILVTEVDGKPRPKIIDFGVAKALSQRLTEETLFTRAGVIVGTPEYMSPEQADSLEDIDTRADVYSLGVILYELLVGSRPLELGDPRKLSFGELMRRLREEDAPRPSTRLRSLGEKSERAAQNRRTEAAALTQQLRGDLDAIALKALEKERSRRYGAPSELAADIRRYLRDEPVLASAPSAMYRARKFTRRHRWGVVAAASVALALIALAVSMTVQSARIARERDRANREAETARQVADFLTGIFNVADPSEARGNTVTAREILDKGARQIETSLAGQPEVQARLMANIADVYSGLGLYQQAAQLLGKSVAARELVLGPDHPDTLNSQRQLGWLEQRLGHYPEAEKRLLATLDRQRRKLGGEHPDTLYTEVILGGLYYQEGHYAEARDTLSRSLDANRRVLGPEHKNTLQAMHNLAMAYDGLQLYGQEEGMWRELAEAQTKSLGPDHPSTLSSRQNLAYVLYRERKYAEAENLQRAGLADASRILGTEHSTTLMVMGNLSNTLKEEGRLAEAEKLQRDALEVRRRVLGAENPETLFGVNNLAEILVEQSRYQDAKQLLEEALAGERRVLGENHPEVRYVWYNLGAVEALQGHTGPALQYLRGAVQHGFNDAETLAADKAWTTLRSDPRFQDLLSQVRNLGSTGSKQEQ